MNRCPITYEACGNAKYSKRGLKLLSSKLEALNDFPFTPKEQIQLASQMVTKLSIQGLKLWLKIQHAFSLRIHDLFQGKFAKGSQVNSYLNPLLTYPHQQQLGHQNQFGLGSLSV